MVTPIPTQLTESRDKSVWNTKAEVGLRFRFKAGLEFDLAYMGYGATANAIQDGTIVGMNVPAGVPVTAITRAFAMVGDTLTLLSFTDEHLEQVLRYVPNEWADELPRMRRWLRSLGLKVPQEIHDELWHIAMNIIGDR